MCSVQSDRFDDLADDLEGECGPEEGLHDVHHALVLKDALGVTILVFLHG